MRHTTRRRTSSVRSGPRRVRSHLGRLSVSLATVGAAAVVPLASVGLALEHPAAGASTTAQLGYVVNSGGTTVTPFSTVSNLSGTPINVGSGPFAVAITPNGQTAYVVNNAFGNGDPDHHGHRDAGDAHRRGNRSPGDRHHPQRPDRLRDQYDRRHGDPHQPHHQHRRDADHRGLGPDGIAISPDGKTVYVANSEASG